MLCLFIVSSFWVEEDDSVFELSNIKFEWFLLKFWLKFKYLILFEFFVFFILGIYSTVLLYKDRRRDSLLYNN